MQVFIEGHHFQVTEAARSYVESVIDSYAVDEISTKVRDSYFKFLNNRKSFSNFDISNYLNSRKI